jgi:diguanylate cyclase (GGDEF)-like protein
VSTDLTAAEGRWPGYRERAVELGLHSVAALPLSARGTVQAVLDLYRPASGGFTPQEVRAGRVLADVAASYLVLATERDAARAAQHAAAHRSLHDDLTGLPGRALLRDRLRHCLATSQRRGTAVAVASLDLEDFSPVADRDGRAIGDRVVRRVAQRLASVLRAADTLAKVDGDSFVLVCHDVPLPGPRSQAAAQAVVERVRSCLAEPVEVGELRVDVRVSVGVAVSDDNPQADLDAQADALLRSADAARSADRRASGTL